jgi:hypothetical protein
MSENGEMRCFYCQETTHKLCEICSRAYCVQHESAIDPSTCVECVQIANTSTTSEPLVDAKGVTHAGQKIRLVGEAWIRSKDVIARMTDQELRAKLLALQEAVREAQIVLDYRRITHSWVENELEERSSKKMSRLRLIKNVSHTHALTNETLKGTPQAEKNKALNDVMKALGNMGLSKEQVLQFLSKAAQKK